MTHIQIERKRYRVMETKIEQINESGICTDEKEWVRVAYTQIERMSESGTYTDREL